MLAQKDKDVIALIARSPDRGDGWRTVSATCWPLIEQFTAKALIEIDEENRRVRLSEEGTTVAAYVL